MGLQIWAAVIDEAPISVDTPADLERARAAAARTALGGREAGVDERWRSALALLPDYLAWHVVLSASALGLGLLVGAPLAITARRRPRLRAASLGLASLIQTIPSLALLALFFPLLLALSRASRMLTGHGFSALGFLPSLLALSLYSLLPILRNGTAALMGVHAGLGEAARSLGLTRRQALWLVELPAAAPVFMGGVRTAAVWVIGAATLSTPVGQTSLGNFIFSGLQTENWVSVVVGCIAAAALALCSRRPAGGDRGGGQARRRPADRLRAWRASCSAPRPP